MTASTKSKPVESSAGTGRKPIAVPEPGLTPDLLIARAVAMRELIRADQDAADARGCPSAEIQEQFVKNGFYRITQPRLFGGHEFDYTTFNRVMMEVTRGNPGTGWCLALGASHAAVIAPHRVGVPVPIKKVRGALAIALAIALAVVNYERILRGFVDAGNDVGARVEGDWIPLGWFCPNAKLRELDNQSQVVIRLQS